VHPELQKIVAATPVGHLTLLTTRTGRSYGVTVFSEQFRAWCKAANLPQRCVFHGTAHEIAALTGHASLREIERYTRAADQARMARSAMAKTVAQEQTGMKSVKPDAGEVSNPLKTLTNA